MITRCFSALLSLTISLSFLTFSTPSRAAECSSQPSNYTGTCTDEASTYNMTMKALRLRKANSDEFVTIIVKDQVFNFAAVGAGETVGSYLTAGTIPSGTYDAISPILAPTLSASGSTSIIGGATCRTRSDGNDLTDGAKAVRQIESMNSGAPDGADNSASFGMNRKADMQYLNPDGNLVLVDSAITGFPITVTDTNAVSITMIINAAESMEYDWVSGICNDAHSGGIEVSLTATVTE